MTLREESSGKKQLNVNARTMWKVDHLKDLALWAVSESSVSSLGAFFGQRLAATTEALGLRTDPSLFLCQRCESILQVGHNCTVRIEKNISKPRHRRKNCGVSTQNIIVYKCHFCSHRNIMRGTPKGYIKQISLPKAKPPLKSNLPTATSVLDKKHTVATLPEVCNVDNVTLPVISGQDPETSRPESPVVPQSGLSLLDAKKRKRKRSNGKRVTELESSLIAAESEKSVNASSKRRRKSWTSLKEIAQRSEHDAGKKLSNVTIPFVL